MQIIRSLFWPTRLSIAPLIIAGAVAAGAQLLSSQKASGDASSATKQGRQYSYDRTQEQRGWEVQDRNEQRLYDERS